MPRSAAKTSCAGNTGDLARLDQGPPCRISGCEDLRRDFRRPRLVLHCLPAGRAGFEHSRRDVFAAQSAFPRDQRRLCARGRGPLRDRPRRDAARRPAGRRRRESRLLRRAERFLLVRRLVFEIGRRTWPSRARRFLPASARINCSCARRHFFPYLLQRREYRHFAKALPPASELLSRGRANLGWQSMLSLASRRHPPTAEQDVCRPGLESVGRQRRQHAPDADRSVPWLRCGRSLHAYSRSEKRWERELVGDGIICDDWGIFPRRGR